MKKDWTKYGFTTDGHFACPLCHGKKEFNLGTKQKPFIHACTECGGSGYLVDALQNHIEFEQSQRERTQDELTKLLTWVRATSKCSKCQGNSYKTFGGCPCEECGLEGTQPWGG